MLCNELNSDDAYLVPVVVVDGWISALEDACYLARYCCYRPCFPDLCAPVGPVDPAWEDPEPVAHGPAQISDKKSTVTGK